MGVLAFLAFLAGLEAGALKSVRRLRLLEAARDQRVGERDVPLDDAHAVDVGERAAQRPAERQQAERRAAGDQAPDRDLAVQLAGALQDQGRDERRVASSITTRW